MNKARFLCLLLVLLWTLSTPAWLHAQSEPTTRPAGRALSAGRLNCPQATMFEFLRAMGEVSRGHDEAWPAALATLDLEAPDAPPARVVAEQLHTVLDQLGEVRQEDLPDVPSIEKSGIRRFQYFPRVDAHGWVWKEAGPPGGKIVIEQSTPGGPWLFSARTCKEMNALAASLAKLPPKYVPDNNQIFESLAPTFQRTHSWDWLRMLAAVALGLVFGKLAQIACRSMARRGRARNWLVEESVFRSLATPLFFLLANVGFFVGVQMIFLEQSLSFYVVSTIKLLFIINVGWLLYNLTDVLDLVLRRITSKTESTLDDMLVPMLRKILRIFLFAVFALIIAKTIFGLDITGWLAGFGIAGLAVSLAAQDSIKNLFGSVTVFFDNPFAVGDRIIFGTYDCVIEEIGFRSTRVRTLEGNLVTIPNAKFIDGVVENISARKSLRRQLAITIPQKTSAEKTQALVDSVHKVLCSPGIVDAIDVGKLPPRVAATDVVGDKLIVRVQYWYTLRDGRDTWSYQTHCQRVNVALVAVLSESGVEFTMA